MSYLVLARKYRPQNFDEVVGQGPVVRTLRNALKRQRVAHAMLFSGVRGVGKTTLARIMAKSLNCAAGPTEVSCGQCASCREIRAGAAVDLHEIDGASNRGIQEIRELKENIRFFPSSSRYKIIIIDEVHMLTTEAFNALLKTLEEPPEHVIFMFATTELHKIPVTILSRCQRHELHRVAFAELTAFFRKIAASEQVTISEGALEIIAREAEGSVRDGLSLLDQIFSFGGAEIAEEDVTQVLGLVDRKIFAELAQALLAGDLVRSLELLERGMGAGLDLKRFVHDLLAYSRTLLVCRISKEPERLLEVSDRELEQAREIAEGRSPEALYQLFQLFLQAAEAMSTAPQPRLVLEMAFIKATQGSDLVPTTTLLARLDELLQTRIPAASEAAPERQPRPPSATSWSATAAIDFRPETREAAGPPTPSAPSSGPATAGPEDGPGAAQPPSGRSEGEAGKAGVAPKEVRRHWEEFVKYVLERKRWMAQVLELCASVREQEGKLLLKYHAQADCKVLQEPEHLRLLTEFAQDFFQRELPVEIRSREQEEGAGAAAAGGPQAERRALAADPLVQTVTEVFGGQVVNIRTGPRSR